MTIIAALSGTHSTGKSTTTVDVINSLESKGFKVETIRVPPRKGADPEDQSIVENYFSSPERETVWCGFTLNQNSTYETEKHIISSTIKYDLEARKRAERSGAQFIIYDRCILDVIPYSKFPTTITQYEKDRIRKMVVRHFMEYPINIVFRPEILATITEDGVRSPDLEYQKRVDKFFDATYRDLPDFVDEVRELPEKHMPFKMPIIHKLPKYSDDPTLSKAIRVNYIESVLLQSLQQSDVLRYDVVPIVR